MAVDYDKLIFLLNAGLEGLVKGDLTFPVAEELPRLPTDDVFTFRRDNINPPFSFYVSRDESIEIHLFTADVDTTLTVTVRVLTTRGRVAVLQQSIQSDTASGVNTLSFSLVNGQLLSVVIDEPTVATGYRPVYAEVHIAKGGPGEYTTRGLLLKGYVRYGSALMWPGSRNERFDDGAGWPHTDIWEGSGVGTDLKITIPPRSLYEPVCFKLNLVCDATVINRRMVLLIDDGSNQLWRWLSPAVQAASSNIFYEFAPGPVSDPGTAVGTVAVSLPRMRLLPGWHIKTQIINLQAGDTINSTPYVVNEWQLPGV